MSFEKAQQLLELATFVASRRMGVTLNDVGERLGISKRTSQRILHTLEVQFPDTQASFDENGHKRWRLQTGALRDLLTLTPDELAALDLSIETLERNSLGVEADQLRSLREKTLALVPRNKVARLETDHEALLEAQGLAARPGPTARLTPEISAKISMALKGSERLKIVYHSRRNSEATVRVVEPYGVLIGMRRYLVAKSLSDPDGPLRYFVADKIQSAELPASFSNATRISISISMLKRPLALFRTSRSLMKWFGSLGRQPQLMPVTFCFTRHRYLRTSPTDR
jgi:predicted DNA-binding transcriptional regulator YafY